MKATILKNFFLVLSIFSGLGWAYCVGRIFTWPDPSRFPFKDQFINGVPISILETMILFFVISGTATWLYLLAREAERL